MLGARFAFFWFINPRAYKGLNKVCVPSSKIPTMLALAAITHRPQTPCIAPLYKRTHLRVRCSEGFLAQQVIAMPRVQICPLTGLTPRQEQLLAYLKSRANSSSPSYREIARHMGWKGSGGCVRPMLDALVKAGYIELRSRTHRNIVLLNGYTEFERLLHAR